MSSYFSYALAVLILGSSLSYAQQERYEYRLEASHDQDLCVHMTHVFNRSFRTPWDKGYKPWIPNPTIFGKPYEQVLRRQKETDMSLNTLRIDFAFGSELFGDSTPLLGGGKAADGFAALAQEDTNADGIVDAADARFADLRVWQDLDQDGISQEGELKTLDELGIAVIHVGKTEHSQLRPTVPLHQLDATRTHGREWGIAA